MQTIVKFAGQEITVEIPEPIANECGTVALVDGRPRLSVNITPNLKKVGVTRIKSVSNDEVHPEQGPVLWVETNKGKNGLRLSTRPELAELVANRRAINDAIKAATDIIAETDRVARLAADEIELTKMRDKAAELEKLIPADHVPVITTTMPVYDGGEIYTHRVGDLELRTGVIIHGIACAIRPGALAEFDKIIVASISAVRLSELRAEAEVKAAEQKAQRDADTAAPNTRKARLTYLKDRLIVTVLKVGSVPGEDGSDPYADVEIHDNETGEKLRFSCRNIFDFGYVVNPSFAVAPGLEPGGMTDKGQWMTYEKQLGWRDVRPLTETETLALELLHQESPISRTMRM